MVDFEHSRVLNLKKIWNYPCPPLAYLYLRSLKTVINFDERTSCPVPHSNNTHHIKQQFVILWSPLAKYMT